MRSIKLTPIIVSTAAALLFGAPAASMNFTPAAKQSLNFTVYRDDYDMNPQAHDDSNQTKMLTDDFINHFSVVGTPEKCVERLKEIARRLVSLRYPSVVISEYMKYPVGRSLKHCWSKRCLRF